jgi:hypothetical protein
MCLSLHTTTSHQRVESSLHGVWPMFVSFCRAEEGLHALQFGCDGGVMSAPPLGGRSIGPENPAGLQSGSSTDCGCDTTALSKSCGDQWAGYLRKGGSARMQDVLGYCLRSQQPVRLFMCGARDPAFHPVLLGSRPIEGKVDRSACGLVHLEEY